MEQQMKQDRLRARIRRLAGTFVLPLAMILLFGNFVWMNVRPDDPLPSGFERYTPEAFREAQLAGRTILVDVYAVWCTTCRSQQMALKGLLDDEAHGSWTAFRVDFDSDREFLRAHGVQMQSTLIVFDGEQEISRSVGLTRRAEILSQLNAALAEAGRDEQDDERRIEPASLRVEAPRSIDRPARVDAHREVSFSDRLVAS
jgi:thiol:disulfide interchange protein